ncbi:MAG: class IV adenylate cyclase [Pirellulaceae bacterium]|jgi:predicted adenylyl cyclase CyaB|nr:class IV adenylate cyclase [Pirellulaceae bacterium]MDP7018376.1 class IV adenylate cyclase [Pirellulaceae bacterium]
MNTNTALRGNLELKAQLADLAKAQRTATSLPIHHAERQDQIDTYFGCGRGRLKLREIELFDRDGRQVESRAELIWYERPDLADAKRSRYHLVDVVDAAAMKAALSAAGGQLAIVCKRRWIYLFENVRIHLDRVDSLGDFLEFEAVLSTADELSSSQERLSLLRREFEISDADLLEASYGEMILGEV